MAIDKSAVRVGGANATDPATGLPMFRRHIPFNCDRDAEFISVNYEEWLEANGKVLEFKQKFYLVKNIPAITHVDEDGNTIEDSPAYPRFDVWYGKRITQAMVDNEMTLGQLLSGAINYTLINLPFDVPNGYAVHQT